MRYYKIKLHYKKDGELIEKYVVASSDSPKVGTYADRWFNDNIEHDSNYGATTISLTGITEKDFEDSSGIWKVYL